ncbi:MAG TPA: YceI family protein [Bryobacteraceae bacterium]|nr:YceI family protein [Bryobacteraceae bacterium]
MLRRSFALALCTGLILPVLTRAEVWKIDPNHTSAEFSVRHMGISTVRGAFTKASGTVDYTPGEPTKTSIDVTIDAASVDTRVDMRDKDLKGPHFLDVEKNPTITFKSTKVEPNGQGKLKAMGDLTIHGVTKQVILDVDGPTEPVKDPRGNLHMGASATTKIDRTNFGMDQMTGMVGAEVTITIDAELTVTSGASGANK